MGDPAAPTKLLVLVGVEAGPVVKAFSELGGAEWTRIHVGRLRRGGARAEHAHIAVVARSVAELRRVLPFLVRAGSTDAATLAVLCGERADLLAAPSTDPRFVVLGASRRAAPDAGPASVTLRTAAPVSFLALARAVLTARPRAGTVLPAAGLRVAADGTSALVWTAGDPAARFVDSGTPRHDEVTGALFDVVVGSAQADSTPPPADDDVVRVPIPRVDLDAGVCLPPVDSAVLNPRGYRRDADAAPVELVLAAAEDGGVPAFVLTDGAGVELRRGDLRAGLTEDHIGRLRAHRWVRLSGEGTADANALGRLLTQLACTGVPTAAPPLPAALQVAMGAPLAAQFTVSADQFVDPVDREDWSVRTRRLALARFAAPSYWSAMADQLARPGTALPGVDALLVAGRPDRVAAALDRVARQDWPDLHTVLVLQGVPADQPTVAHAVRGFARPLVVIEADGDDALGSGAAHCGSRLVARFGDERDYGPHHVTDLVHAWLYSGASMIGLTVHQNGRTEAVVSELREDTMLLATSDLRALGAAAQGAIRAAGGTLYAIHDRV